MIMLTASFVPAQAEVSMDERILIVEKKIEGSTARGDLMKSEYSRLKPRLAVFK